MVNSAEVGPLCLFRSRVDHRDTRVRRSLSNQGSPAAREVRAVEDTESGVLGWLMRLEQHTRTEVTEVAGLISGVDPRLNQAIKWGRLTFAIQGNWHHWLCSIAVTKRTSNLVFHKGVLLEDPERMSTRTLPPIRDAARLAGTSG
jgi:hypothetical protein